MCKLVAPWFPLLLFARFFLVSEILICPLSGQVRDELRLVAGRGAR